MIPTHVCHFRYVAHHSASNETSVETQGQISDFFTSVKIVEFEEEWAKCLTEIFKFNTGPDL